MLRYIKLCLLIVSVYIINLDISNAFSAGPPPAACDSMVPGLAGHAVPSSDIGTLPYTLTVNGGSTTYATEETITLTLTGTSQFRGFFIQARRVDSTSTRVGSWTAGIGQSTTTSCSSNQAISHSSGSLKSSETVTFIGPDATTTGNIQFYFTVVQERLPTSIYWAFQLGPTLSNSSTTATTPTPTSTSQTTAAATVLAVVSTIVLALVC